MTPNQTRKPMNLPGAAGLFIKGALIGIANIIPGVSGGTFALILGVYERLLAALHNLNPTHVKALLFSLPGLHKSPSAMTFPAIVRKMDLLFLICLAAGAGISILGLSYPIDYLLTEYPDLTLSFFLGLLIPSIAIPWKMMKEQRTTAQLTLMIPGIALTIGVSLAFGKTAGLGDSLPWSFLTGAIAVSAMILPGISGSFVLLVMGQYQNILRKLQSIQETIDPGAWLWLAVFALGCIAGLLVFARFLKLLLKHRRNATLAFLIGLILGSFWILWPFKHYDYDLDLTHIDEAFQQRVAEKKDIRVATAPNALPESSTAILWNGLYFVLGLIGALGLNRLGSASDADERIEPGTS
jgi:putative membrane protein